MTLRVDVNSLGIDVGTVRQWREHGITTAAFRSLVRAGELRRYHRGVYVRAAYLAAAETDPAARHALRAAAMIAAGQSPRAIAASHQSAALIHGLDLLHEPDAAAVSLTRRPGGYRGTSASGVTLHSARLPRNHVMWRHGVWVTTATRTVIDLARSLPFMDGVVVADAALRGGKTTEPGLAEMLRFCARWPGNERARRVVDFADELSESVLESCARVVFAQAGLPAPELQVGISDEAGTFIARVDFYWARYRTAAQADGMAKYSDPQRARQQIQQDNRLRDTGNKVVHFGWAELFQTPKRVIKRVETAFAAAAPY